MTRLISSETIGHLAEKFDIPLEDALFIALNIYGVDFECEYNRMRMAFRLSESGLFQYAKERGDLDYYFALPVNPKSPFVITDNTLRLQNTVIGQTIGVTEDVCDSHYPRRKGTSLNINPNSRTLCHGCQFCYTAYQVSHDRKRLITDLDLREFFEEWMHQYGLTSLSHLVQVSVVTGCYESSDTLCRFLTTLKNVLAEYNFTGKIFYLGSQIVSEEHLKRVEEVKPFGLCYSLEVFERRNVLRKDKASVSLQDIYESMEVARELGYEVNFSYIVGMESLRVIEYHLHRFKECINKFPTINTFQMHKYHQAELMAYGAHRMEYYLEARKLFERLFISSNLRPLVWEDYRGLWFLKFGNEPLLGIRTP